MNLDRIDYRVKSIDGDYAHLVKLSEPEGDSKLVARALLPADIKEGSRVVFEMLEYRSEP